MHPYYLHESPLRKQLRKTVRRGALKVAAPTIKRMAIGIGIDIIGGIAGYQIAKAYGYNKGLGFAGGFAVTMGTSYIIKKMRPPPPPAIDFKGIIPSADTVRNILGKF